MQNPRGKSGGKIGFPKHRLKQNIRFMRFGVKQRKIFLAQGLILAVSFFSGSILCLLILENCLFIGSSF